MILVKNALQLEKMRTAGMLLYDILQRLSEVVAPGVTTREINALAHRLITENNAVPSFLNYKGFPASLCTSVNEIVVHGIPDDKPLREGDILGIDCGLILDGWHADSAFTAPVGKISDEAERLIAAAERCFWTAASLARKGNRIGDLGSAVHEYAKSQGFDVVRELCGHGIGRNMHEEPEVPNFGKAGRGQRLVPGMTIAVEPMITAGKQDVDMDGWLVRTRDRRYCSHYEHTLVITDGEPEILTMPPDVAAKRAAASLSASGATDSPRAALHSVTANA